MKEAECHKNLKMCSLVRSCAKDSDQWSVQTSILLPSSAQVEMAVHACKKGVKKLVSGVMKKDEKKPKQNRKESYAIHVYMAYVGPPEYKNFFQGSEHYEVIHESGGSW